MITLIVTCSLKIPRSLQKEMELAFKGISTDLLTLNEAAITLRQNRRNKKKQAGKRNTVYPMSHNMFQALILRYARRNLPSPDSQIRRTIKSHSCYFKSLTSLSIESCTKLNYVLVTYHKRHFYLSVLAYLPLDTSCPV